MEYKFRVWDYDAKKMYYQDELIITFDKVGEDVYVYKNGTVEPLYNYKIMEYVGVKDCNNTRIYRGDIVVVEDYYGEDFIGQVIYDKEKACYFIMSGNERNCFKIAFDLDYINVVIGNIYENENLLED